MLAVCPPAEDGNTRAAFAKAALSSGKRPAGALPFGPGRQQAQVAERVGGGLVGLL